LLACVNFMNLATARALKRSKEVGVRKVIGAKKSQLVFQFISEAIVLSGIALAISLVLAELVLPFFNQHLNLQLTIPYSSTALWLSLVGLVLFAALLAGFYPAFYLSSFNPASVLKSSAPARMGGADVRKTLVVFQFAISITLIICSTIAYYQINYLRNAQLGFDKEHILVIDQLGANATYNVMRDKLEQSTSVKLVVGTNARPGVDQGWGPFAFETTGITAADNQTIGQQLVSYDFFDLLGLEMVAGRKFDKKSNADVGRMYMMRDRFPAYDGRNYIINEAAAKLIGKTPEEALGMPMRIFTEENGLLFSDFKGNIVGVVKDYHATSLRDEIKPTAYLLGNANYYGAIIVKLQSGNVTKHVASIEKIWKEVNPTIPLQYSFLDEDIDKQYQAEEKLGIIIATFSGMVLFVACLGLFGLSAYTAELKTKEIGIRKVLGASTANIVSMLSKEFLILLLIALAIAIPVGWYSAKVWLDEFAYRVPISVWFFVGAGLLCIVIALLTISWQSIKAAVANPVDSLKSE
jgi:putative ABC transport system permease protein